MLSFIDGLLLRFRPFNAIAQIKRINRPSSLLKNLEIESFRILAGRCWGDAVELDVIF